MSKALLAASCVFTAGAFDVVQTMEVRHWSSAFAHVDRLGGCADMACLCVRQHGVRPGRTAQVWFGGLTADGDGSISRVPSASTNSHACGGFNCCVDGRSSGSQIDRITHTIVGHSSSVRRVFWEPLSTILYVRALLLFNSSAFSTCPTVFLTKRTAHGGYWDPRHRTPA